MISNTNPRGRWLRVLLPVVVLSLALGACASAGSAATAGPADPQNLGSGVNDEQYPAASAAAAAPEAPEDQGSSAGKPPADGSAPLNEVMQDRKIVYTGSLELVVDDLAAALAKAKTAVLATGGYIGGSEEHNDGDRSVATITYRIPATRWEDAMDSLRGLATRVVGEQTQAAEVGSQLVDIQARLRNLRASEEVLVGIAKSTGKVNDLLEVEARISDVRGQIEQLDAQRVRLEDQVAYGTLVTTFGTQVVQVQETAKGWNPGSDVDGATATLISAGQAIVSAAIWFGIVWLPVILVLLVLAFIVRWLFRRFAPKARPADPVPGWGGGTGA
jgi:hypothetical protein